MEHDKSSRVCTCDGVTKLQIRSVTSLLCASTQTTFIPVLGMADVLNRKIDDLLSRNMRLYAHIILACTGINDYNTPRD